MSHGSRERRIDAQPWYRFMLAIRTGPDATGGDWRDRFLARARERGFSRFDADGWLYNGSTPMGPYRFVELDRVAAAFDDRPWLRTQAPCPFVGEVVGFLNWEWWHGYLGLDDRRWFAEVFLSAAHGFVARTDDDRSVDIIARREFPLGDVTGKHGFYDGGLFLDAGPGYDAYVRDVLLAALDRIGLRAELITFGTGHNPFRVHRFHPKPGQTHASCWEVAAAHTDERVRLWGYDLAALGSSALADLLTD